MGLKKKTLQIKTEGGVTDVTIHLCLTMVLVSEKTPIFLCQHASDSPCLSTNYTYRVFCLQSLLFRDGV